MKVSVRSLYLYGSLKATRARGAPLKRGRVEGKSKHVNWTFYSETLDWLRFRDYDIDENCWSRWLATRDGWLSCSSGICSVACSSPHLHRFHSWDERHSILDVCYCLELSSTAVILAIEQFLPTSHLPQPKSNLSSCNSTDPILSSQLTDRHRGWFPWLDLWRNQTFQRSLEHVAWLGPCCAWCGRWRYLQTFFVALWLRERGTGWRGESKVRVSFWDHSTR